MFAGGGWSQREADLGARGREPGGGGALGDVAHLGGRPHAVHGARTQGPGGRGERIYRHAAPADDAAMLF